VLAFADSDLRVGRLWLRSLLAPLQEPGTGASTSMMRYFPARPDPPSLLRCAWVAWAYPYPAVLGVLCGQSMAFRRTDFDALGARKIWAGAFLEDLALVPALRARGGKVAFCGGAASVSAASASWREVFSVFDRWMLGFRIYLPSTWLLACATAAAKLWLLFHARWGLAGLILGMDWLNMLLLFGMVRMTGRPALFSILAAPLLPAAFAWSLARSAFVRESVWGKYRYRLGSGGVRAEPFADAI
jgi:ceramide glucosyltransferase